ncbi:MAG TPA: sigma-70 family RNA polymerase sigma factor [Terriglobales bacterium]|nr:sigma-70 family RNA polymerase sigma factor [Terriglobales bacterium]
MLVEFEQIQKAQAGDGAAFAHVIIAYRKRILGTIVQVIRRPDEAEDVAQEVYLRLYDSLDQLRVSDVFESWLYRLTVNLSYDYLRKQRGRRWPRISDLSEHEILMADAAASSRVSIEEQRQRDVKAFVDSLLGALSEQDQVLLMLKYVEGLSLKELENVYSVNANALKQRLSSARRRVRDVFEATGLRTVTPPARSQGQT